MFKLKNLFGLSLVWISLAFAPVLQAKEMVSVNRPQIYLRSGAGTQHDALWALSKGFPLEVTGHRGNWVKVRDFENDVGWVYRPLVSKTPHMIVKSATANVRSSPSTHGRLLGKVTHGEVLRTLEHRNKWVNIQSEGGLKGWIARRLLWGW
ncbi:MAG: SH3 domain-containing protein [Rhodoferax sp.]|uniref:SH3 domain-containing protein n=1 Tax=Rhodoferax sp. TaxID=50421 RepID=UPI00262269E5|nr:SH3 domain-containing protein [Rhodoferax sp.]MDD2882606.1 SH3 domain-containing protein [Rhodoferax sp.]